MRQLLFALIPLLLWGQLYSLETAVVTHCQQLGAKLGLVCTGVLEDELIFVAKRRATIEEARGLVLALIHKSPENMGVKIHFSGMNGKFVDGTLSRVSYLGNNVPEENRNHLFYYTSDPFYLGSEEILKESRDEALQRKTSLTAHSVTEKEREIDLLLPALAEEIRQKHQLSSGPIGGKMAGNIEEVSGRFTAYRPADIQEARAIMVDIANTILHGLKTNEIVRPYLADYPYSADYPFRPDRLRFRLDFVKRNHYPYRDGSLESVVLDDGKLTYLRAVPTRETKNLDFFPDSETVLIEDFRVAKYRSSRSSSSSK